MLAKVLHLIIIVLVGLGSYEYGRAEGSSIMASMMGDPLWGCIKLLGGEFKKNGKPE